MRLLPTRPLHSRLCFQSDQVWIADNSAVGDGGGLFFFTGGSVINSTFYNNTATELGGGIYIQLSDQTDQFNLQNSLFVGNTAADAASGHQAFVSNADQRSIVNIQHNQFAGGGIAYLGPGATGVTEENTVTESNAAVVFVSTDADDDGYLRLKEFSPAVGAGNNDYVNNGTADPDDDIKTDAAGETRIQSGTVDLGAYESTFAASTAQTITFTSPAEGPEGSTITLIAMATSTGAVTFAVTEVRDADGNVVTGAAADAVATLGGTMLTLIAPGMVTVTALQTGGDISGTIYAAATQRQTITVMATPPTIRRVTTAGDAGNDGSSWAAMTLQAALAASTMESDQVWIAQGTYLPDATDVFETFNIPAGVLVYGGFEGDEASFTPDNPLTSTNEDTRDRNATTGTLVHKTVLSGDLEGNDLDLTDRSEARYVATHVDNSFAVVIITGAGVTLNGVTIQGGNVGTRTEGEFVGAGLHSVFANTTVVSCTFTNNNAATKGGGAYFGEEATLTDCTFTNNHAIIGGGGGAYFNALATLTNCVFTDNVGNFFGGGAVFHEAKLTDCSFENNEATRLSAGGAFFFGAATLTRCVFIDNTAMTMVAGSGAGGASFNAASTLTSCVFRDNVAGDTGLVRLVFPKHLH